MTVFERVPLKIYQRSVLSLGGGHAMAWKYETANNAFCSRQDEPGSDMHGRSLDIAVIEF